MARQYTKSAYLALFTAVFAAGTLIVCYYIAFSRNHFPSWLVCPSPSYLSVKSPERYIYGVGFSLVGLMNLVILVPFVRVLQARVEREYQQAMRSTVIITIIAFLCLVAQALVPMQSDVFEKLDTDDSKLSFQSLFHQTAASIFLLMSWLLITLILYLSKYSPRLEPFYSKFWWQVKALTLIIPGVTMLFGLFYQVDNTDSHPLRRSINASGFSQIACVACVVVFFGTFFHDFRVIDNVLDERPATVGVSGDSEERGIEMQMRARSLVDHAGTTAADEVEEGETHGLLRE